MSTTILLPPGGRRQINLSKTCLERGGQNQEVPEIEFLSINSVKAVIRLSASYELLLLL